MRIVVSPREHGRAKEENSIISRHVRRVEKMVDVILVARVRMVDGVRWLGGNRTKLEMEKSLRKTRGEIGWLLQSEWRFCGSL